jgi:hypothetical protein
LRNIDAGGLNLTSASRVNVLGGDYGPMVNGVSHINACGVEGCFPAEDILIDGALFHDYSITDPEKHSECLMIWPGRRVTIRNSTFRNCTDFDVLVKPYNTGLVGSPGEITLENNIFDEPIVGDGTGTRRGGNAIALTQGNGEGWSGVQLLYNSSLGGIRIDAAVTNAVVTGNIARKEGNYSCRTSISFSYNLWTGASCSATDRTAPFADVFVGPTSATFDLRLKAGSPAIGTGNATGSLNAGALLRVSGRCRSIQLVQVERRAFLGDLFEEPAAPIKCDAKEAFLVQAPRTRCVREEQPDSPRRQRLDRLEDGGWIPGLLADDQCGRDRLERGTELLSTRRRRCRPGRPRESLP